MKKFVKTVFIIEIESLSEIICYLLDNFSKEQINFELIMFE